MHKFTRDLSVGCGLGNGFFHYGLFMGSLLSMSCRQGGDC